MHVLELHEQHAAMLRASGRSLHTLAQAARHARMLAAWLEREGRPLDAERLTHRELAAFLTSRDVSLCVDGRSRRATSANSIRSGIRGLFGFAAAAGLLTGNPAALVQRARASSRRRRVPTDEELRKLRDALSKATTPTEVRDKALILLLISCGPRIASAVSIRVEDVDLEAGTITLRTTKNGRDYPIYPSNDALDALRTHMQGVSGPYLFPGEKWPHLCVRQASRRLEIWCDRAGLEHRLCPHALRHALGTRIHRQTGDLHLVGAVLGHVSVASSAIYATLDPARVRAATAG